MKADLETVGPGFQSQLPAYAAVLRRRARAVILVAALAVLVAIAISLILSPLYEAKTRVLVESAQTATGSGQTDMETQMELASSGAVASIVAKNLKTAESQSSLLSRLSVDIVPDSKILEFRYASNVPSRAQAGAQAFANAYLEFRQQKAIDSLLAAQQRLRNRLEETQTRLRQVLQTLGRTSSPSRRDQLQTEADELIGQQTVLRIRIADLTPPETLEVGQIIDPAGLPSSPVSPNLLRNSLLAGFLGLATGIGVAFLLERLEDRIRTGSQLEGTSRAPLLAVLPREPRIRKGRPDLLITVSHPDAPLSESYRTLRAAVLFTAAKQRVSTILITSPHGGDGKTTVAANLGVVIANSGKRVILVSADRRRPRLHRLFGAEDQNGLTQLVNGDHFPADLLISPGIDNLRLLPSGRTDNATDDLLTSSAMRNLLRELRMHADFILIDAPPILPVADTLTLAPLVDAVLFVTEAGSPRAGVLRARQRLDLVNASVMGSVLNNLDIPRSSAYEYAQYAEARRPTG